MILRKRLLKYTRDFLEDYMENHLRPATPVRTGALRNSWRLQNLSITTDKPYAIYLEYGTDRIRPRRFIHKSLQNYLRGRK